MSQYMYPPLTAAPEEFIKIKKVENGCIVYLDGKEYVFELAQDLVKFICEHLKKETI